MRGDKNKGLYNKFNVSRTDGSSAPGGKHEKCRYFVLDLTHDKFAIPALQAYSEACSGEYPALFVDLQAVIRSRAGDKISNLQHNQPLDRDRPPSPSDEIDTGGVGIAARGCGDID